jgi:hypothetical protein
LVDGKDGAGARRDQRFDLARVHIKSGWLYVHKHGRPATVADAVGRRDKRVANRKHLVARPNAQD